MYIRNFGLRLLYKISFSFYYLEKDKYAIPIKKKKWENMKKIGGKCTLFNTEAHHHHVDNRGVFVKLYITNREAHLHHADYRASATML